MVSGRLPEMGVGVLDADQDEASGCVRLPGIAAAPERSVISSMTDAHLASVAERLGVRAGDLIDATEDAARITNRHPWPRNIASALGGAMRASRVWDAFVDVWVQDVLDGADRETFVSKLTSLIPQIS